MTIRVQLRNLPNGKQFLTLGTKRHGIVLAVWAGRHGPDADGVLVALEGPDEEKTLHGNVVAEARVG